jgi:hypothetical protein
VRYLRAAAHFGHFLHRRRRTLDDVDAGTLKAFRSHLPRCHYPLSNGGTVNHHVFSGPKRFLRSSLPNGDVPGPAGALQAER